MAVFTVQTAKADLDQLIARAEAGEEIVIARADKPAVRLTPVANSDWPKLPRQPGALKGQFVLPDDFFDPLSEEELRLWEDGPIFPPEQHD
jgi:prevent-host-death family protein